MRITLRPSVRYHVTRRVQQGEFECYASAMVDVGIKTAVEKATEFAKASLGPERTIGLRLEEIESSEIDGEEVWLITLSSPLTNEGPLAPLKAAAVALGADLGREYKVFAVRKRTGEVVSMKIRLLAAPIVS